MQSAFNISCRRGHSALFPGNWSVVGDKCRNPRRLAFRAICHQLSEENSGVLNRVVTAYRDAGEQKNRDNPFKRGGHLWPESEANPKGGYLPKIDPIGVFRHIMACGPKPTESHLPEVRDENSKHPTYNPTAICGHTIRGVGKYRLPQKVRSDDCDQRNRPQP